MLILYIYIYKMYLIIIIQGNGMRVQVVGKGIEIGESLKTYVEKSLESHVIKYFSYAIDAKAIIYKDGCKFHVDISVNEGVKHGVFIKASAILNDPYLAVNKAIIHISTKLRRYKHKLKDYKKPRVMEATQHMVTHNLDDEANNQGTNNFPLVTEEKTIEIQFLSVAEAIMHLEFSSAPALMFINVSNNQLNMVYKKEDGNITWVEAPNAFDKLVL